MMHIFYIIEKRQKEFKMAIAFQLVYVIGWPYPAISDHQQSWWYEEGPSKGPGSAGGR